MTATLADPKVAPGVAPPEPGRSHPPLPLEWILPAALTAANLVAALPWLRGFAVGGTLPIVLVAAIASVLPAVLAGGVARRPPWVSFAISAGALIVLIVAGLAHSPGSIDHGLRIGPTHLLTETLPLTGSRSLLVAPVLVIWVAGSATGELAVRAPRSALGLAPPALAFLAAYAATSGAPERDALCGPIMLGFLGVAALTRKALTERSGVVATAVGDAGVRRARTHLVVAGAVIAAALTVGLGLAVRQVPGLRGAPRGLDRPPPTSSALVVNPVATFAALRDDHPKAPPTPILSITTSGAAPGYLPVVDLDDFNGDAWSFERTFSPTGRRILAAPAGTVGTDQLVDAATLHEQVMQFATDGLPFLAATGRALTVSGVAVDANPATGMLEPSSTPTYPLAYTTTSRATLVTLATTPVSDGLERGGTGSGADLAVPGGTAAVLATGLRYLAAITGQQPAPTLGFLQAAQTALQTDDRRVNPAVSTGSPAPTASRGGTSLAEVITSVVLHHRATPEQFATFYVLMARQLGVPARLVTGFRVQASPDAPLLPAGSYQVTNRDAWSWAEVPVAGVGWVVADPTPVATATASSPPATGVVGSSPTTLPPHQASAVPSNVDGGTHAVARPSHLRPPHHRGPLELAGIVVGAGLLALLLLGPGLAGLRRTLRRQLRRSDQPAAHAAGAWLELLDGLEQVGLRASRSATPADIAVAAAGAFGEECAGSIRTVGGAAEQALYASSGPDMASARAAWAEQRRMQRRLLRRLDARERLRAMLRVGHQVRRPGRGRPAPTPAQG